MFEIVWANTSRRQEHDRLMQELVDVGFSVYRHWSRIFEWPWTLDVADVKSTDIVLEAGGGSSPLQYFLAKRANHVVNFDSDQASLDKAELQARAIDLKNILFRRGDLCKIPYPDGHFDKVVSVSVVEHITDTKACLNELWRVLKPGGSLVLTLDVASHTRWNHTLDLPGVTALLAPFNVSVPPYLGDSVHREFDEIDPKEGEPKSVDLHVLCVKIEKPI